MSGRLPRHVFMTLAALAVALKVLIPQGMMVATEPRNDLPFPLVLCTAQGAVSVAPGAPLSTHDEHEDAKLKHEPPCVFAGHGVGAAGPAAIDVGRVEFIAFEQTTPRPAPAGAPGRGVSGPPLPARGPPASLI